MNRAALDRGFGRHGFVLVSYGFVVSSFSKLMCRCVTMNSNSFGILWHPMVLEGWLLQVLRDEAPKCTDGAICRRLDGPAGTTSKG